MSQPCRRVAVSFYAGYRGEETPRAVDMDGRKFTVDEVLTRSRELDQKTGTISEVFRVRMAGRVLRIRRAGSGEAVVLSPGDLSILP